MTFDQLFIRAGFAKRVRNQRYDKLLLTYDGLPCTFESSLPAGVKIEVLGEFDGFSGYGTPCVFSALVVTLPNGLRVPAYRNAESTEYAICQAYAFKAVQR